MGAVRYWLWDSWQPFRLHWFFVLLTALVIPWLTRDHPVKAQRGEWYPFSNFPMYSDFEDTAYYVYLTDRDDKPLGIWPTLGSWPTAVKKTYDALLKSHIAKLKDAAKAQGGKYSKRIYQMDGEECRPAGDATLRQMTSTSKFPEEVAKHAGFRLYQVDITLENGRIVKRTKKVGEI